MRVFTPHPNNHPRVEYDSVQDKFVEHPEQPFTLIADNEEEHLAIIELIKRYTTIDEKQETKP